MSVPAGYSTTYRVLMSDALVASRTADVTWSDGQSAWVGTDGSYTVKATLTSGANGTVTYLNGVNGWTIPNYQVANGDVADYPLIPGPCDGNNLVINGAGATDIWAVEGAPPYVSVATIDAVAAFSFTTNFASLTNGTLAGKSTGVGSDVYYIDVESSGGGWAITSGKAAVLVALADQGFAIPWTTLVGMSREGDWDIAVPVTISDPGTTRGWSANFEIGASGQFIAVVFNRPATGPLVADKTAMEMMISSQGTPPDGDTTINGGTTAHTITPGVEFIITMKRRGSVVTPYFGTTAGSPITLSSDLKLSPYFHLRAKRVAVGSGATYPTISVGPLVFTGYAYPLIVTDDDNADATFTRSITVDGVATNADAFTNPTISIIRLDTGATVVATTSTGITNPTTGTYSYTIASPAAGVTYQATWTHVLNRRTVTSETELIPSLDGEDLITLAEMKSFLNISSTTYDTLLAALITSASLALAHYCEKDSFKSTAYSGTIVNGNGQRYYTLPNTPVTALGNIIIDYGGYVPRTYAGSVFDYESKTGEIRFKRTATALDYFYRGFQNLSLSYSAGLSSIPEDLKLICKLVVKYYYQQTTVNSALKSEKIGGYSYENFQRQMTVGLDSDPALDQVRTLLAAGSYYRPHVLLD